ncbi:hypothetical protein OH76DRAFT_176311 [Lentinus brumalis]|uniref:Protein kinase domain-containing protein n=1 Tax=Lentinus brumalis TaxID=2498619 RepID=A0A371CNN4_9APHY|nr:hypothetical protein OH76DRAFT_176311 [Polyporus brumalis]
MLKLQFPQDTTPRLADAPAFKDGEDGWDKLEAYYHGSELAFDIRATIRERIHNGNMRAFRVAYGRRRAELLKKEADLYRDKLASLQGKWVPAIFGCYLGQTVEAGTCILVMQDCGRPLPCPFYMLPPQSRAQVVDGLHHLHKAGIVHRDFTERNVVIQKTDSGKYWLTIVDFGEAREHDCPCKDWKVELYAPKPVTGTFGCAEMWNACAQDVDIWRPRTVRFYEEFYPADWAASDTPEEFLEKVHIPDGIMREDALEYAYGVITRYREAAWTRLEWDKLPLLWKD